MSADPRQTALDWITIWQSELAAAACDRELREGMARLVEIWAQAARTIAAFLPGPGDGAFGRAGAGAAAGTPAAHAAPDARDLVVQRLADRVAELERLVSRLGSGRLDGTIGPDA